MTLLPRLSEKRNNSYYSLLFAFIFMFSIYSISDAWGADTKGSNRKRSAKIDKKALSPEKSCAALTKEDIKEVLKKLDAADAKIIGVSDSTAREFCEVVVESKGRTGIFYIDLEKKHLMLGNLYSLNPMQNLTAESINKVKDRKRIDTSAIPLKEALTIGDPAASKKVIVFTDPDCGFCGQLHQTMKQLTLKRKDIAFYIKFFPLDFHKDAYWKSKSIVCSKSIKMLEDNFERKEIKKVDCNTSEVDDSKKLAQSFGFDGTPTMIMPDGRVRVGAIPESELIQAIDRKM